MPTVSALWPFWENVHTHEGYLYDFAWWWALWVEECRRLLVAPEGQGRAIGLALGCSLASPCLMLQDGVLCLFQAKIFLVPMHTSYLSGLVVITCFVLLLLFQTGVVDVWLWEPAAQRQTLHSLQPFSMTQFSKWCCQSESSRNCVIPAKMGEPLFLLP